VFCLLLRIGDAIVQADIKLISISPEDLPKVAWAYMTGTLGYSGRLEMSFQM
jgi:hypothetical protein